MSLDRSGDNHPRGMLGKQHSPGTIEQYSKDRRGKNHHMYGKHHSDKTRKKISETNTNNPKLIGDIIVKHHYIYNHTNPELYTTEVTRSKHAKIHMWMRKAGIKVPHINRE